MYTFSLYKILFNPVKFLFSPHTPIPNQSRPISKTLGKNAVMVSYEVASYLKCHNVIYLQICHIFSLKYSYQWV
jgi:hypothetical protein